MRILGITLKDYRGVADRTVTFAPTGVTVVEGPNEIGKSSIAEALDRIIEDLDSSGSKRIQAIKPVDRDVGPEIAVEIESGPYAFRYRKRFLKQPVTELQVHRPRPEHHTGREAHARVQAILGETVDMALWKALRVQQGDQVRQASLRDQTSLAQALDRSAGEAPAAEQEDTLYHLAEEEYLRFWTEKSGRPKQEGVEVERQVADATTTIDRLSSGIRDIEADVESSLDLGTESRRLVEDRATKRTLVEACQVQVDALAGLEARVAAAEARQGHAALAATEARRTALARAAAIVAIDIARTERDRLATAAVEDSQRSEAAGVRVTEADAALVAARSERDRARSCVDAAQARLTRERDATELMALEERATRGRAAHTAIKTASPDAASPVTTEVLAAIREQQRAVDMSRTRLEAGRPQLRIAAYGPLDAVIDGTPTRLQSGGSVERRVDRVLRLDLPGVASIKVSAGATTDELTAELARAEARLAELLRNAGARDLAEAERLHRRREEASRTVAEQQRILDHALHGLTPRALMERIGVLRPKVAAAASDPADGSDPVDLGQAEAALALADRTLRESEQAWQAAHEKLRRIEVAGERRATEARMTADDLARREEALVAERATMPDEVLQQRVVEAEGAERAANGELEASRTELAQHGPDEARRVLADAKRDLDAIEAETRLVQDRLLQVTTRLEEHGEDGLAEDLVEAQTRRDHAEAELRRYQTQAAARKLLFDTLREERDRARRSYVGPLRREVEELGRTVFGPGFGVDLDDSLSVVSRTLDGRTIPYASLSIGAQEQVAIVTRLACATIVAPDGGVPVILDDALGNSDPRRLDAMSEVLGAAGRQCQIIVLTCQPERYDHIPGATLVSLA